MKCTYCKKEMTDIEIQVSKVFTWLFNWYCSWTCQVNDITISNPYLKKLITK